jgi:hypothetical protein
MNAFSNLSGEENGIYYDATSGRLYQKEVTWECEQPFATMSPTPQPFGTIPTTTMTPSQVFNPFSITSPQQPFYNPNEIPAWFREWMSRQQPSTVTSSNEIPAWFREWMSRQTPPPATQPPNTSVPPPATTSLNEMPPWFKEWMSRQPPPQPQQPMPLPQTPYYPGYYPPLPQPIYRQEDDTKKD